jgi:alkylated DNA nucleotide flippase Atl1
MTYGLIAEILQEQLGYGGPRVVGNVMASAGERFAVRHFAPEPPPEPAPRHSAGQSQNLGAVIGPAQDNFKVPWWRVVNAAGGPPPHHLTAALTALIKEKTPLKTDGTKVDLKLAIWFPQ